MTDPAYVSDYLHLPEQTAIFAAAEPGMDKGWWAEHGHGAVESRKECFGRGAALATRFTEMAKAGETDVAVLVSHGDLMDCILKALLIPGQLPRIQDSACRFVHSNTGITRLEIARDGMAFMLKYNLTAHLDNDPELLTGGELVHDWHVWDKHHGEPVA